MPEDSVKIDHIAWSLGIYFLWPGSDEQHHAKKAIVISKEGLASTGPDRNSFSKKTVIGHI